MELDYYESPLVIVGGWNPHILLSDEWINSYFINPLGELGIEIEEPQRFSHQGIGISLNNVDFILQPNKIEFRLRGSKDFSLLQTYAFVICDCLPATPVTAYGVNIHFKETGINSVLYELLGSIREYSSEPLFYEQYNYCMTSDKIPLHIGLDINNQENVSGVRFNFEFDIDSLAQFKSLIQKHSIESLKAKTIRLLSDMYNINAEG
ncbi:MAG: hypothetical protein OXN27_06905 [Candidatus Poribacteria bacterium]|nr:hypothetical protein [Candidatus Poribacteria bacterium]